MKYLAHHAVNSSWAAAFVHEASRYLDDPNDVSLFGFLVRDVAPKKADLAAQATRLGTDCPPRISIELQAIYLPEGAIAGLVARVETARAVAIR